ncbi:hypothetical protein V6X02_06420 [Spiribacter sp. 1M153]|uniref:hypothetical protein n=1 Tax=Spiribacter roseus TaxID=1855875 RepID=UPI00349F6728
MTNISLPRANRIRMVYSPLEDRLALRLTMASGEGRIAWLSRRALHRLMQPINETLKQSHPAAEGEAAHDAVMALEHIGARSQVAAQRHQDEAGETTTPPGPEAWTHWLVTEARVESQHEEIVIALMGQPLPGTPDERLDPMPIAGLSLIRAHAHEVLRLMHAHAEKAGWSLDASIGWITADR